MNLPFEIEQIARLQGADMALHALIGAILEVLPEQSRAQLPSALANQLEGARGALLASGMLEPSLQQFEADAAAMTARVGSP